MKPTLRLFVSSTFQDFVPERRVLNCTAFPDLSKKLEDNKVGFLPIDLRWGVTEESAKKGRTMEICHLEVERACRTDPPPDFLLLVGNRYGWRPLPTIIAIEDFKSFKNPKSILKNSYKLDSNTTETLLGKYDGVYRLNYDFLQPNCKTEGLRKALDEAVAGWHATYKGQKRKFKTVFYAGSATHQEFEIAKEQVLKNGRKSQIVVYIKPFENIYFDDDSMPSYLKKLGLGIEAFRNFEEDNNTSVILRDWEKTKEHILGLASLPEIQKQKDTPNSDKQLADDFIKNRCLTLVGRENEIEELLKFINTESGVKVVSGGSGSGKSTLLAGLLDSFKKTKSYSSVKLLFRFIGVDQNVGSERDLLDSLICELGGKAPSNPDQYEKAFRNSISAANDQKVVLVIDALNQLSGETRLRWISDLPDHVCVVVSMIEEDKRFFNQLKLECVSKPFDIVSKHLEKFNRVLSENQRIEIEKYLKGKSALHLVMIAGSLRDLREGEPIYYIPESVPDMLNHLHEWLVKRHIPHVVNRVFSLLLVAKFGVTEVEISEVLNKDEQLRFLLRNHPHHPLLQNDPLPPILWSSLWEDIRPYISIRQRHGEDLLSFIHPIFEEHFSNWYSLEGSAQLLSQYYLSKIYTDFKSISNQASAHILEEVINCLVKAPSDISRESIAKLLTDLEYIQQRCAIEQNEAYRLIDDFKTALSSWPDYKQDSPLKDSNTILMLIEEAIRSELCFIAATADEYPQGVMQTVVNYLNPLLEYTKKSQIYTVESACNTSSAVRDKLSTIIDQWKSISSRDGRPWIKLEWLESERRFLGPFNWEAKMRQPRPTSLSISPSGKYVAAASKWISSNNLNRPEHWPECYEITVWSTASGEIVNHLRPDENCVNRVEPPEDLPRPEAFDEKFCKYFEYVKALRARGDSISDGLIISTRPAVWSADPIASLLQANAKDSREDPVRVEIDLNIGMNWSDSLISGDVKAIEWLDDTTLTAACRGGRLFGWNVFDGKQVIFYQITNVHPDGTIRDWNKTSISSIVRLSSDKLVIGTSFSEVKILKKSDGLYAQLHPIKEKHTSDEHVLSLALDNSGKRIAVGAGRRILILDSTNFSPISELEGHGDSVTGLAWSPDGNRLASIGSDAMLRLWDLKTRREVWGPIEHPMDLIHLAWGADGQILYTTWNKQGIGGAVRSWDISTGKRMSEFANTPYAITSMVFDETKGIMFTGQSDGSVRCVNITKKGTLITPRKSHATPINHAAYSRPLQKIATLSVDGILIWSSQCGVCIDSFQRNWSDYVNWKKCIMFSPDSRFIVAVIGHMIHIFDSQTLSRLWGKSAMPRTAKRDLSECWISLDSKYLVTSDGRDPDPEGRDKGTGSIVWNLATGAIVKRSEKYGSEAADWVSKQQSVYANHSVLGVKNANIPRRPIWDKELHLTEVSLRIAEKDLTGMKLPYAITNLFQLDGEGQWIHVIKGAVAPIRASVVLPKLSSGS